MIAFWRCRNGTIAEVTELDPIRCSAWIGYIYQEDGQKLSKHVWNLELDSTTNSDYDLMERRSSNEQERWPIWTNKNTS